MQLIWEYPGAGSGRKTEQALTGKRMQWETNFKLRYNKVIKKNTTAFNDCSLP